MMRRLLAMTLGSAMLTATPAAAQMMMDLPIWSNGILGQQALRNTYDNFNEKNGIKNSKNKKKQQMSQTCSADALPIAERRQMEVEYARRVKADGKASADAWVHRQGQLFHQKLVARGDCPAPAKATRTAQRDERKEPAGKNCRMVTRPVAGLGGAPMTMGMTRKCD